MEIGKLTATTHGQKLRFDVSPGSPLLLGRSNRCAICVPDPKVSREHCRIEFVDGRVRVTDLASSHGLTYRGQRHGEVEIEVGDGFHVGETFVRFEARATAAAAEPASEVRREVPVQGVADDERDELEERDEDVDQIEHVERQRAAAAEPDWLQSAPAEEYPDIQSDRRPSRRRRGARRGGFVGQLLGQLCLFVTIVVTTVAVILALKHHNPDWDVYRLLELLRPRK